jgi:hypothetical protein
MTVDEQDAVARADDALNRFFHANKVRFAVCNKAGQHSGIWTAFAEDSGYYIGARAILGSTKISFHSSRRCRVAFDKRYAEKLVERGIFPPEKDRAFIKWIRPETPPKGALLVASLIFPVDYLKNEPPKGKPNRPLIIFEADAPSRAVELGFFYSLEPLEALEQKLLKIGKPLFRADFENGESVSMVARIRDFDPKCLPGPDELKKTSMKALSPEDLPAPGSEQTNLNLIFWNQPTGAQPLQIVEIGGVTMKRDK